MSGELAVINSHDSTLIRYEAMCQAIAECHKVDEAKNIRDKAEALRAYCRQAENKDLEVKFAEIKLRAERRAGELLIEMREIGQLAVKGDNRHSRGDKMSLLDLGIEPKESERFQEVAEVSKEVFEGVLSKARRTHTPVTSTQVRRLAIDPDAVPGPQKLKVPLSPELKKIADEKLPNGKPLSKGDPEVLAIWGQLQVWEERLFPDPKMTPSYIVMGLPKYFWPDLLIGIDKTITLFTAIREVIHANT